MSVRLFSLVAAALAVTLSTPVAAQSQLLPHEQAVIDYLKEIAFDPDAVQIKEITPLRTHTQKGGLIHKGWTLEYACVTWNGKNRYGGYVGYKTDALVFQNGKVVNLLEGGVYYYNRSFCPQ